MNLVHRLELYVLYRVNKKLKNTFSVIHTMETIFIITMIYMFAVFYQDATRHNRMCSNQLRMCDLELEKIKLYLEVHNIRLN